MLAGDREAWLSRIECSSTTQKNIMRGRGQMQLKRPRPNPNSDGRNRAAATMRRNTLGHEAARLLKQARRCEQISSNLRVLASIKEEDGEIGRQRKEDLL